MDLASPTDLHRQVLWAATVGPASFDERVDAAAGAGYPAVSLSPADHRSLTESGRVVADVVAAAADRGVAFTVLDAIIDWYPFDPPKRPFPGASIGVDDFLRAAVELGAETATALAPYPTSAPAEALVASFATLCDRAAEAGVRIQLEFTPFPPVPDLATAWDIVRLADRPNGGLLLDTWHYFRGRPDAALLASIPGDRFFGVQVNDGGPIVESVLKDTYRHRRVPGDGDFDLVGALGILRRTGGLRDAGPEVLSDELAGLGPLGAAVAAAAAFDAVADRVNAG